MKRTLLIILFLMAVSTLSPLGLAQEVSKAKSISALEAMDRLAMDSKTTFLVDVRSRYEFTLTGHAPKAYNVPWRFLSGDFQVRGGKTSGGEAEITGYQLSARPNPDFMKVVTSLFKPGDTLIIISAHGKQGAEAAEALAKDGFKQVCNIRHGFLGDALTSREQDKLAEKYSPHYQTFGRVNGWVFWGLPVTNAVDPRYIYPPDIKRIKTAK